VNINIRFARPPVKMLIRQLKHGYGVGDLRLVRRISALLDVAWAGTVAQVAETHTVARRTVYNWPKSFLLQGEDSLVYRRSPGCKSRLTKAQKKQLVALVKAGPQAAGFPTACWTSLLIQQLIQRKSGVL